MIDMTVRCPRCHTRVRCKQGESGIPEVEGKCDKCGLDIVGYLEVKELSIRYVVGGDWMHARNTLDSAS